MNSLKNLLLLLTVCVWAKAIAEPEDAGPEKNTNPMEEIVVTANQLDATVADTHYSLSIFLEDDLRKQTDLDLDDLLSRIPNIEVDPLEGLIVRGLATRGLGGDIGVHLYLIDGAWTSGIFHKWDMDQLEVLRGTQSTVGSSAGGTFGLNYKEPGFEPNGKIMVNYEGRSKDQEAGIAFGGPLVDERLSYRLAAYQRQNDGLLTNQLSGSSTWQSLDETFARGKINWYPEKLEGDELSFEVYYLKRESGGSGWVNQIATPADAFARITEFERDIFFDEEVIDLRLRYEGQVSDRASVRLNASYNMRNDHRVEDRNNQASNSGYNERKNNNADSSLSGTFTYDLDRWRLTGLFYSFRFDTNNTSDFVIPLSLGGSPSVDWRIRYISNNRKWLINGARLTANYNADKWYVTAAVGVDDDRADTIRNTEHDRVTSSGDSSYDTFWDGFIGGQPAVARTDKYHAVRVNPTLAFGYDISQSTTLGVKLEQATRRGWDRINAYRAQIYSYDPETSTDLDVFLRTTLFDDTLVLNANLFTGVVEDQQIEYCFSSALFDCHIVNAGKTDRAGLEFDSWLFMGPLKVWVAGSYLDAKFAEFTPPVLQENGVLVTNPDEEVRLDNLETLEVPNSPSWKFSGGLIYERGKFFTSFDLTIRPGTNGSISVVDVKNDRRSLLNGRVGWRFDKGFELSLWSRNLMNEEYFLYYSASEPGAYVGEPRKVGVTLQYDWGR